MNAALAKVLLILLILHSCTTGMRFTVTLDALRHGGTPFEIGLMLSTVALFPAFLAVTTPPSVEDGVVVGSNLGLVARLALS